MVSAKSFTLCATSLPEAARERLDADSPLDWTALEDPATGIELAQAVRDRRRLPEPVEMLVTRLIGEVGIVADDLAAGIERTGAASAWRGHFSIEPDGDSYRLRNRLDGAILAGIRPETVAGYAALALALATVVRETAGLWIEAGERQGAENDPSGPLARCAIAMSGRLTALSGDGPGAVSTATLSRALEDTWNAQGMDIRAGLATAVLPGPEPGACAPRPRFLAPAMSYRLHACDPGEMRWLRALAERAGAPGDEAEPEEPELRIPAIDGPSDENEFEPAPEPAGPATAATVPHEPESDSDDLSLGRELAELQRTADRLAAAPAAFSPARAGAAAGADRDSASLDMSALEMQIGAEGAPRARVRHGSRRDRPGRGAGSPRGCLGPAARHRPPASRRVARGRCGPGGGAASERGGHRCAPGRVEGGGFRPARARNGWRSSRRPFLPMPAPRPHGVCAPEACASIPPRRRTTGIWRSKRQPETTAASRCPA